MSPAPRARSSRAIIVLGALVSVAFVAFAIARLDRQQVVTALRSARPWPFVPLAIAAYLLGHVVRGVRCRLLLRRQALIPLPTATNVVVVGYAVNNVMPARLGEFARSGMLAERTGIPFTQALTVTFLERILDGLSILGLLVAASLLHAVEGWLLVTVKVAATVFGGAAIAVVICGLAPEAVRGAMGSLTRSFPPKLHVAAIRAVDSVGNGLSFLTSARDVFSASALSVLVWILESCMFLALLPAMGLPANPVMATTAMAITNLGILVPSSPGFIGPFHFFCMKAVQSFGVQAAPSFGYAVLVHAAFYVPITIWGMLSLAWYGVQLGTLLNETRSAKDAPTLSQVDEMFELVAPIREVPATTSEPSELLSKLTEALIPWAAVKLTPEERSAVQGRVAAFVAGQLDALPLRLRILLNLGLGGFRAVTVLSHGRSFCALPEQSRAGIATRWAYRGIRLSRMLFRPIRSVVMLAFFEQAEVKLALALPKSTNRRLARIA